MQEPCPVHDGEAALILRAVLAPHYMTLRRLLAQMAGLLLLADSRRSETQDGIAVSLASLGQDLTTVEEVLAEIRSNTPGVGFSQHAMERAARSIRAAMTIMTQATLLGPLRHRPDARDAREQAVRRLQEARTILGALADERNGFVMVGLSHACCCGGHGLQANSIT